MAFALSQLPLDIWLLVCDHLGDLNALWSTLRNVNHAWRACVDAYFRHGILQNTFVDLLYSDFHTKRGPSYYYIHVPLSFDRFSDDNARLVLKQRAYKQNDSHSYQGSIRGWVPFIERYCEETRKPKPAIAHNGKPSKDPPLWEREMVHWRNTLSSERKSGYLSSLRDMISIGRGDRPPYYIKVLDDVNDTELVDLRVDCAAREVSFDWRATLTKFFVEQEFVSRAYSTTGKRRVYDVDLASASRRWFNNMNWNNSHLDHSIRARQKRLIPWVAKNKRRMSPEMRLWVEHNVDFERIRVQHILNNDNLNEVEEVEEQEEIVPAKLANDHPDLLVWPWGDENGFYVPGRYPFQEASEAHGSDRVAPLSAAVLLKFEMSADNKTLLLDDTPILPLQNYHIPPRLSAYQVPTDIERSAIVALGEGDEFAKEKLGRMLELDYDRLVEGDPTGGPPYYNHKPILRFRIMGFGAEGKDDILDTEKQDVVQMVLEDRNNGSSSDPLRSYMISSIGVLSTKKAYSEAHMGPEADQEEECTRKSWKCPDGGVYEAGSPYRTPYRFIWRRKFDEFGRVGSLRHDFVRQWEISMQKAREDPWNSALVALGILLSTVLAIVGGMKSRAKPSAPAEEPPAKPVKKEAKAPVEDGEEEEGESEDEDLAWLTEQVQQAGEVPMTIDEASQLIDLMSEDELKDEVKRVVARKNKPRKRVTIQE
ncbi:hypothetical protein N0V90_000712 [Kalmusia sp. IMI 367209]|nr:hypothetical protein N0V90_000712 [Kalmusia sp. IMI 367209]